MFTHGHDVEVHYDPTTMADYFLTTGDFREPGTRDECTDDDLFRLDSVLARLEPELRRPSVLFARYDPSRIGRIRADAHNRDAGTGLDHVAGEFIVQIVQVLPTCYWMLQLSIDMRA